MDVLSSHHIFFFFFFVIIFLVILPNSTLSSSPFPYHFCKNNFTKNTILNTNIQNTLIQMVAQTSLHGYAITTYQDGSTPAVYGITRCQLDTTLKSCSACISDAAMHIRSICPNSSQSLIWYETCFLRYDTRNFIGKSENLFPYVWMSANVSENRGEFGRAVRGLMGVVMAKTAEGNGKFWYGEKDVNKELKVYGMGQCTRDLGVNECNECLQSAKKVMVEYCGNKVGCRVYGGSCIMRYDVFKFSSYGGHVATAPAPSPTMLR